MNLRKFFMPNSIENQIARLEQELKTLKELVNKPKERWKPQVHGGQIFLVNPAKCAPDAQEYRGLVYNDIREANDAHVDIINYARMRKFAHERNGNWIPDWTNRDQPKFVVTQNMPYKNYEVLQSYVFRSTTENYFKNHADAQELADLLNNGLF